MSYTLDPELVPLLAARAEQAADTPVRERGDWKTTRQAGNLGQAAMAALVPPVTGITTATYFATAPDGARIELRWYTTGQSTAPGPAVLYAHGGGMILGDLDAYDTLLSWYVAHARVPFLSVGYRLAPEASGTMLAEDVLGANQGKPKSGDGMILRGEATGQETVAAQFPSDPPFAPGH